MTNDQPLPIDRPFFRRIDLRDLDTFIKEEDVHLVEEKLVRVGIRDVEAEMVDQLFLLLLPFGPAIFADLGSDLLSEVGRDRSITERVTFRSAFRALEFVTE